MTQSGNPYEPPPPGSEDPFEAPVPTGGGYNYGKWHRGKTVLTWGIASLVACGLLGIVAWVMGSRDLKEMDAGIMDPAGRGPTRAGKIMGIFGATLGTLLQVLYIWGRFSDI